MGTQHPLPLLRWSIGPQVTTLDNNAHSPWLATPSARAAHLLLGWHSGLELHNHSAYGLQMSFLGPTPAKGCSLLLWVWHFESQRRRRPSGGRSTCILPPHHAWHSRGVGSMDPVQSLPLSLLALSPRRTSTVEDRSCQPCRWVPHCAPLFQHRNPCTFSINSGSIWPTPGSQWTESLPFSPSSVLRKATDRMTILRAGCPLMGHTALAPDGFHLRHVRHLHRSTECPERPQCRQHVSAIGCPRAQTQGLWSGPKVELYSFSLLLVGLQGTWASLTGVALPSLAARQVATAWRPLRRQAPPLGHCLPHCLLPPAWSTCPSPRGCPFGMGWSRARGIPGDGRSWSLTGSMGRWVGPSEAGAAVLCCCGGIGAEGGHSRVWLVPALGCAAGLGQTGQVA